MASDRTANAANRQEQKLERSGWFTHHPLRNEEVHVVTREWFDEVAGARDRYREALEKIAAEWEGQMGTGQMLTDFVREVLS